MKGLLLFMISLMPLYLLGNDTLTMAQVYNFNVGDTFDYRIANTSPIEFDISFARNVVVNKWTDSGLVHYAIYISKYIDYSVASYFDTLIIYNPTEYAIYSDTFPGWNNYSVDSIESNSNYNGKPINMVNVWEFEGGYQEVFSEGLGTVLYAFFTAATGDVGNPEADSTNLIYYSKSGERWGTPWYIANGKPLVHFTPLPEACAVWTDHADNTYWEQVSTGNRVPFNGHTYVELIYRAYYNYYENQHFIPDSFIGYFRNDTISEQTLFYHTLTDTAYFVYDFKQLIDGYKCYAIDQILINGQLRTKWTCGNPYSIPQVGVMQYVEGIGSLNGLVAVSNIFMYAYSYGSKLDCLSVCGQMIYPSDTSALCPTLTGVTSVSSSGPEIRLFPTLNSGQFNVEYNGDLDCHLMIFDVMGRAVNQQLLNNGINAIILSNAVSGIYYWKAALAGKTIQAGKFIIGKDK